MRRLSAGYSTIAVTIALAASAGIVQADGPSAPFRPQSKIIVYQAPVSGPTTVAVMGQVSLPGTYQFPAAPTLADVMQSAKGLKPQASPMVRLVRGRRVAQRLSLATAAHEKLQTGDLVIVDTQPTRDHAPAAPVAKAADGVQYTLLGVYEDRPVVVKVLASRARLETIVAMLGQSAMPVNVIPPPNPTREPGVLPDGSVLVFDSQRINRDELPDLPKIIQCGLPIPDIGGYGIHHAIEERRMDPTPEMAAEGAIPWSSSPLPDDLAQVPLPMLDANAPASPTLIDDDRLAARLSSSMPPRNPISRIPFSSRGGIDVQPTRLSESAPAGSSAVDAKEPAWNKVGAPASEPALAAGGISVLQLASILTSLALIGGLVVTLRARQAAQAQSRSQRENIAHRETNTALAGSMAEKIRVESRATIPTPHIPMQSFAAVAPARSNSRAAMKAETSDEREFAFRGILKNELPLIVEPLALRPGLKISLSNEDGAIRRLDSDIGALPSPHRSPTPAPHIVARAGQPAERHIIDQPHAGHVPGPHLRSGVESPVDRALRPGYREAPDERGA